MVVETLHVVVVETLRGGGGDGNTIYVVVYDILLRLLLATSIYSEPL